MGGRGIDMSASVLRRRFAQIVGGLVAGAFLFCGASSVALAGPPVTSGLVLDLETTAGITMSGSVVTGWADQSGSGHNASASGTGSPTLAAHVFNGNSGLVFNGSTNVMTLAGQQLTSQQYTIFTVGFTNGTGTGYSEQLSNWSSSNMLTSVFIGDINTGTNYGMRFTDYLGGGAMSQSGVGDGAIVPHATSILAGVSGASSAQAYINGSLVYNDTSAIPTRNLGGTWFVGDQGSLNGEYWNGDIGAILVYNQALSTSQITQVQSYLASTYVPEETTPMLLTGLSALALCGLGTRRKKSPQ